MNEHVETLAQIKSTIIDLSIKFGPKVLFVTLCVSFISFVLKEFS